MAWGKSSSGSEGSAADDAAPAPIEPQDSTPQDGVLLALIEQTEQLNDRLTKLENRFDAAMTPGDGEDTDLRSLRVNSERLASELRRVTEEMRHDLGSAAENPADDIDIDLTEPADPLLGDDPTMRLPGADKRSGWLPIEE